MNGRENTDLENIKSGISYGNIKALSDINAEVNKGEIVTLLGANGAGKSTLMKSILGMVHIDSGSLVYNGTELVGKKSHQIVPMGISLGSGRPENICGCICRKQSGDRNVFPDKIKGER